MSIIVTVKQKLSRTLVRALKHVQGGRLPVTEPKQVPFEGHIDGVRFFLGTKTGLMYYDGQVLRRLFEGRVYGISRYHERWYTTWNHPITLAGKKLSQSGSVISFRFIDEEICDPRIEVAPLSPEIHQIDVWGDRLYVTDTIRNRVLVYQLGEDESEYSCEYYPKGHLKDGKKSCNYAHINSVFRQDGYIYLMYHNHTRHTGRESQVAVLNEEWNVVEVLDTRADSAHNVFCDDDGIVYCDSRNGRLVRNGMTLWKEEIYLRGLAVAKDFWLLGGSAFAERSERDNTPAYVYRLDEENKKLESKLHILGCGSLYEIRLISPQDQSISNYT